MSAMANNFKVKFAGLLRGLLRHVDNGDDTEQQPVRPVTSAAPQPLAAAPEPVPADLLSSAIAEAHPVAVPNRATASLTELEMPLLPILEKLPADLRSKWMVGGVDLKRASIAISVEKVLPQLAQGTVKITFGELRHAAPTLFRMGEEYDSLPIVLPLHEVLSRLNPALIARSPEQRTVTVPQDIVSPFGADAKGVSFANTLLKPTPPTTHFFKKSPPPPSESIKMPLPPSVAPPPISLPQQRATPVAPAAPNIPNIPMSPRQNGNGNGNGNGISAPKPNVPNVPRAPQMPNIPNIFPLPTPPRANTPAAPTAPAAPAAPIKPLMPPAPVIPPVTPVARPVNPITPAAPINPVQPTNPINPYVPPRAPAMPTAPVAPVAQVAPQAPQEMPSILAPLAALSESWPEALRMEIAQSSLANAQVALPVHLIEPALRRGRVIFSWNHLRTWIKPVPPGASVHDNTELELPLKVLAPMFVPRKKEVRLQAKATVPPSSVPNLFFGFPQPQPEELVAPLNSPEAPDAPQAAPAIKPVDAKLAETNYYVWGDGADTAMVDEADFKRPQTPATDFSSRRATPKEIIERAMKLPGVAGAIVALPDGLKVAHYLPTELNPDTVAAFLPQLFTRVSQCSKELRMGELNNLHFTTGKTPWKIFRVNAVYFAVFGHAGEPLPTAQLAMLAGELDRKK